MPGMMPWLYSEWPVEPLVILLRNLSYCGWWKGEPSQMPCDRCLPAKEPSSSIASYFASHLVLYLRTGLYCCNYDGRGASGAAIQVPRAGHDGGYWTTVESLIQAMQVDQHPGDKFHGGRGRGPASHRTGGPRAHQALGFTAIETGRLCGQMVMRRWRKGENSEGGDA